jgi:hypothetical protein
MFSIERLEFNDRYYCVKPVKSIGGTDKDSTDLNCWWLWRVIQELEDAKVPMPDSSLA